jgi:hypothetical protein
MSVCVWFPNDSMSSDGSDQPPLKEQKRQINRRLSVTSGTVVET